MTLASVRASYPCLLSDLEKEGVNFDISPAGNMVIVHSVPITIWHSLAFQRVLSALLEKKNIVVLSAVKLAERGERESFNVRRWKRSQ